MLQEIIQKIPPAFFQIWRYSKHFGTCILKCVFKAEDLEMSYQESSKLPTYKKSAADDFENIAAKGEFAHYEQFSPFVVMFSKVIYSRGVRERLYVREH